MNPLRVILRRPVPPRVAIVAAELSRFDKPRYLELGVHTGVLFLHVRAHRKVGVDPAPRVPRWKWFAHPNSLLRGSLFRTTSDRFFAALEPGAIFHVIFVDGLHSFEQSRRDVDGALAHLAGGGVILVHDANPPSAAAASADSAAAGGGPWCGEVWRTIVDLRATRPELEVETLDTDCGIGVVRRRDQPAAAPELSGVDATTLTYDDLAADRKRLLGLRPPA